VIRNSSQYRRLYDINGKFKSNVGARPLRTEVDTKTAQEFAKEHRGVIVDRQKAAAE